MPVPQLLRPSRGLAWAPTPGRHLSPVSLAETWSWAGGSETGLLWVQKRGRDHFSSGSVKLLSAGYLPQLN